MTVLSAIFTTAFNDQITFLHPCMGVKTPAIATKRRRIITPEQFGTILDNLPTRDLQLLVETDVETGLRWGELIELRAESRPRQGGHHGIPRRPRTRREVQPQR